MNNLAKVLIGVGVVGAVATATYIVTRKTVKKETVINGYDEQGNPVVEEVEKEESVLDRIKQAAFKKAVKILAWAALHQQQIEAAGALIGLIGGIFAVVNAVKEFNMGKEMKKKMDFMYKHDLEFEGVWNAHMENQAQRYDDLMKKLNDIHLDMGMIHEIQEMLVKPRKKGA